MWRRYWPALLAALSAGYGAPALADGGAWLLNDPPNKLLKDQYGVELTPEWLEHVQRACVRFGRGGSASIVSADGLVMTNHHIGHDEILKLSRAGRDLVENGYCAATRADELRCEDLTVFVLWSIADVTRQVNAAAASSASPAEANEARRRAIARLEAECEQRSGLHGEVVTLYRGALYHLYQYKPYDDVRLVWAPAFRSASFGGDVDNFEYPRYALDAAFFRIYENGAPLKPEHYLRWGRAGAQEGELAFVVGHPYQTQQSLTVDHLRFLRDVEYPTLLRRLWRREAQLLNFCDRSDELLRIGLSDLSGVRNTRKAFTGYYQALLDPAVLRRKIEAEQALRAAVAADPAQQSRWGDAWDTLKAALDNYATFQRRYSLLEGRRSPLRGDLYGLALRLTRYAAEREKPNEERLEEYRDPELELLKREVFSTALIHDALEHDRLQSALTCLAEELGGDDPLVVAALRKRSPAERATQLIAESTVADLETRRILFEGGLKEVQTARDAMIDLVATIDPAARALRRRYELEFEAVERDAYARLAETQFVIQGQQAPPDATGSLRLSYGAIRGYGAAPAQTPAFTTFAGLYERAAQRRHAPPFDLDPRWEAARPRLDLATQFNFITTAQVIGGNSGSPVLNGAGEVIGLIFDINLDALAWNFAYTDQTARSIALDGRGLVEALRKVYGADALADELAGSGG